MKALLRYAAAPVVSALLLACSFPPLSAHYLAWVALVPLLWACHDKTPRQVAGRFFLTGWIFQALLLNWLAANVFWAGFRALIGWQLLSVYLALYWAALGALFAWLIGRLSQRNHAVSLLALLLLPFLWVVMEWAQATLFTGLGSGALGYGQAANPWFLQWASVGGVFLLSFILVGVNTLLLGAMRRRPTRAVAAVFVICFVHGGGYLLLRAPVLTPDSPMVALFQSSFPQLMKWDATYHLDMVRRSAEDSLAAARRETVDLIVWPEALVMEDYRTPVFFTLLRETARESGAFLFTGTVRRGDGGEHYNSSVLLNPEGDVAGTYDKIHLAPFGEYVPLAQYWPVLNDIVPGGAVDAGHEPVVLDAAGRRLGPLICFEVLFAPMAERLRRDGADVLVVVTNLGWFGFGAAVEQELQIARLRAVETRLPIIHCANTGISAIIDPWGRVQGPNAAVDLDGDYYRWKEDPPRPESTLMQRMLAVYPLPEASTRPLLSVPPHVTPWVCLVVSLVGIAMVLRRKKESLHAA